MDLLVGEGGAVPLGLPVLVAAGLGARLAGVPVRGGAVAALHQLQVVTLT